MATMRLVAQISYGEIYTIIHSSSHVDNHATVSISRVVLREKYEDKIHGISPPIEKSANIFTTPY